MSYRKDFMAVMTGKEPQDFPATEFMMFWAECYAPYSEKAGTDKLADYFGVQTPTNIPYNFTAIPAFEQKILKETADRITLINAEGITCMVEKGTSAMPHYIDFPIKDRETFLQYTKRLDWKTEERVGDLVEAMRVRHFHAILLSKDGPEGFLTVRRLREMDARVRLIFLTDTSQYAVMGVRLHLTDYVVKPVEFKNVVRAMKLAGIGNGR